MNAHRWVRFAAVFAAALGGLTTAPATHAATYPGNGRAGFGGAVGGGSLEVTNAGDTVTFVLTRGAGDLNDALVLYLDTDPGATYPDTTSLKDQLDAGRRAISGWDGTSGADVVFPTGTGAEYAVVFDAANGANLFSLAAGGDGSLVFVASGGGGGAAATAPTFTWTVSLGDLGLQLGERRVGYQPDHPQHADLQRVGDLHQRGLWRRCHPGGRRGGLRRREHRGRRRVRGGLRRGGERLGLPVGRRRLHRALRRRRGRGR